MINLKESGRKLISKWLYILGSRSFYGFITILVLYVVVTYKMLGMDAAQVKSLEPIHSSLGVVMQTFFGVFCFKAGFKKFLEFKNGLEVK